MYHIKINILCDMTIICDMKKKTIDACDMLEFQDISLSLSCRGINPRSLPLYEKRYRV